MEKSNTDGQHGGMLKLHALRLEDMARLLSAAGPKPVTVDMLRADIDDGAPTNFDGTMSLIEYARWLIMEMSRGSD